MLQSTIYLEKHIEKKLNKNINAKIWQFISLLYLSFPIRSYEELLIIFYGSFILVQYHANAQRFAASLISQKA